MGGFSYFDYKNTKVNILGASFSNLPLENLYKTFLYIKPQLIFVCISPDDIL